MRNFFKIIVYFFLFSLLVSCGKGFFKKVDTRKVPISGPERAKQNVKEGRGVGLGKMMGRGAGSTNYEFSTSNPMWRATLDILDFLPLILLKLQEDLSSKISVLWTALDLDISFN